jgi:microcystin-dependent protein
MRLRWWLMVIGVAIALFVPSVATAGSPPRLNLPPDQLLLFALQGESGTLMPTPAAHGRFVLTLRDVPSQLLWFTDRPVRSGGSISTANFVRAWRALGFGKQPPNAVIALRHGAQHANALAVELGRPAYNARTRQLTVRVRALRKADSDLARIGRGLDHRLPRRFGDSALFIDAGMLGSSSVSCNSVGELDLYPASVTPQGYVGANGQLLSLYQYQVLTSAIGFAFGGSGDSGEVGMPAVSAPAGLAYQVCNNGYFASTSQGDYSSGAQCAAGALNLQATDYLPSGWVPADGRMLSTTQAAALYNVIGTSFGGNGQTFAVPTLTAPPGLSWDICVSGMPWHTAPTCTVGQLTPFAATTPPSDYLPANGRTASFNGYAALGALLGTDFGGNGISNFGLPNVPGPATGISYGICASGNWPG